MTCNCSHATPIILRGIGKTAILHFAYFPLREWLANYLKPIYVEIAEIGWYSQQENPLWIPIYVVAIGAFVYVWAQTTYELKQHRCKQ